MNWHRLSRRWPDPRQTGGNYQGPKPNEPIKSFEHNDFVVHGPEGYQRVTARANSKEELDELVDKLT